MFFSKICSIDNYYWCRLELQKAPNFGKAFILWFYVNFNFKILSELKCESIHASYKVHVERSCSEIFAAKKCKKVN